MHDDSGPGYDGKEFRRELEENNNRAVIPGGRNRKEETAYDKEKKSAKMLHLKEFYIAKRL
jgi:hypothetical protein